LWLTVNWLCQRSNDSSSSYQHNWHFPRQFEACTRRPDICPWFRDWSSARRESRSTGVIGWVLSDVSAMACHLASGCVLKDVSLTFLWKCFGVCTAALAVYLSCVLHCYTYVVTTIWEPRTTQIVMWPHIASMRMSSLKCVMSAGSITTSGFTDQHMIFGHVICNTVYIYIYIFMAIDKWSRDTHQQIGCIWVAQNVADLLNKVSIQCSQSVFSICTAI